MTDSPPLELRFAVDDDRPGVTVVDPIEKRRVPLTTSDAVAPDDVDSDRLLRPVDAAVEFQTQRIELPYVVTTGVRDDTGEMILEVGHGAFESLPSATYCIEFMAPVQLFLEVEGSPTIVSTDDWQAVTFEEPRTVRLGARSAHERPAATVTTTADPTDLAAAISTFGSALKTLTSDRSLPSLRGHPPRLSVGDELDVPDGVEPPDTGVEIVAPADRRGVFACSSLAYYLGATVSSGEQPRLATETGFEYELGGTIDEFESSVRRVLEHVFFMDVMARGVGLYRWDLDERRRFESRFDLDLGALYERSIGEQLRTYLSIPFEAVADLQPRWQLASFVEPEPRSIPGLPYLANDLAHVRSTPDRFEQDELPPTSEAIDSFTRSGGPERADVRAEAADRTRSNRPRSGDRSEAPRPAEPYVSPPETDAFETAWLGEGIPTRGNKLLVDAFEHGLDRSPSSETISVTLVCNEPRMAAEYDDRNGALYGDRSELTFDVTYHQTLSTDELRTVLAAETDLLHFIGHVEDGALVCPDGPLDVRGLRTVGARAFLLNGCRSYDAGRRLIEAGGVGAIVTLSDVGNDDATAVGRTVARLLNAGFSLRSAVELARSSRAIGNQYVVVGDGGVTVAQAGGGVPNRCLVERAGDDRYVIRLRTYHSQHGQGAIFIPYLDDADRHFLAGSELPPFELSASELARFFELESIPVTVDGDLRWSIDGVWSSS